MQEIEVQNKINFRNILIFFGIGIIGVINGMRDFFIYQIPISKLLFPDPVVYEKVVVLNSSMMSTLNSANAMSFAGLSVTIIAIVILIGIVMGLMGGVMGMAD